MRAGSGGVTVLCNQRQNVQTCRKGARTERTEKSFVRNCIIRRKGQND